MASTPNSEDRVRDLTGDDQKVLYEKLAGDTKLADYLLLTPGIYSAVLDEQFALFWTVVPGLMVRQQMLIRLYPGPHDTLAIADALLANEQQIWSAPILSRHGLRVASPAPTATPHPRKR